MYFGYGRYANTVLSTCILLLATQVLSESQGTYWVDTSCDKHFKPSGEGSIENMMEESIGYAKLIRDRLIRPKKEEKDAYTAFSTLMKFSADTASKLYSSKLEYFRSVIGGFKKATEEPFAIANLIAAPRGEAARKDSLVRIYCDDNGSDQNRYELVPDDPNNDPKMGLKNSERPKSKQSWIDKVNKVRCLGPPGCSEPNDMMATSPWHGENQYDADVLQGDERKYRTVITLCDGYLQYKDRYDVPGALSSDMWASDDLPKKVIDELAEVGSFVMFHELTHVYPHKTQDYGGTYGWDKCVAQPPSKGCKTADSYSLLAVVLDAMERDFALLRTKPTEGTLHKYDDIPKRVKHTTPIKKDGGTKDGGKTNDDETNDDETNDGETNDDKENTAVTGQRTGVGPKVIKRDESQNDINKRESKDARSGSYADWLQAKRDAVLACEDEYNSTAAGLRCEPFQA